MLSNINVYLQRIVGKTISWEEFIPPPGSLEAAPNTVTLAGQKYHSFQVWIIAISICRKLNWLNKQHTVYRKSACAGYVRSHVSTPNK